MGLRELFRIRRPTQESRQEPRRATIEDQLCRQAMQPGQFEELEPTTREKLSKRIKEQLAQYSIEFLEEAATAGPNAPTILLDEALNVSFAQRTQGAEIRGVDPLEIEAKTMEEANAQGLLFHGYDPDGVPIITSMDQLTTHMAVVGTSGTGKSTQLARYFVQLAMKGGPMILIDPHGTLIHDILPRLPAHRRKDVVYITPNETKRNWGINLLQVGRKLRASKEGALDAETLENVLETTVQTIVQALAQIQEDESGLTAGISIQSTLQMFAQAAAEHPDATFVDVYQIATSRKIQDLVKGDIRNPIVRQYFEDTLPQLRVEYLERVRNKLQKFVSSSAMVNMFSRRREGKDLKTLIEEDRIILFDLDRKAGLPFQTSNLIGFIVVTMAMLVVDHRKASDDGKLKPFYMLIDEFQNVASKSTVRWLTEARKQGASLIVAFQHLNQLSEEVRNALGNASTWCVFRSTPQDARFLAPMLGLGSGAKADLSELVEVPQFEMRLRYDEEDVQAEARPMKRSLVTVKAPPLPKAPPNAQEIVAAIKAHSSRLYTLPVNPADKETILGSTDTSTIEVLRSVFEASLALENKEYPWRTQNSKVRWAIENGRVTSSLAHHILGAKGLAMTWDRFGGLKEALVRRRLITVKADQSGLDQISLTARGIEELARYIVPNRSSLEGGPAHKTALKRLFIGLGRTAPMRVTVPSQVTQEYTPDLVGEVPGEKAPTAFLNRVADKKLIHFHVEEATRTKPERVFANLGRAVKAGAFPVMVVHSDAADPESTRMVAAFFEKLNGHIASMGTYPVPEELKQEVARNPHHMFVVWLVTKSTQLYEYSPDNRSLIAIDQNYEGRGKGRKAQPSADGVPARPSAETAPAKGPVPPEPAKHPALAEPAKRPVLPEPAKRPAPAEAAKPPPLRQVIANPIQLQEERGAPDGPRSPFDVFVDIMSAAINRRQAYILRVAVVDQMARDPAGGNTPLATLDEWAVKHFRCRIEPHPMKGAYHFT